MPFELDSWNLSSQLAGQLSFVNSFCIILVGYVLQRVGVIRDEHISGLHMATFTLALPSLMLGLLWTTDLDSTLLAIVPLTAGVQLCTMIVASFGVRLLPFEVRGLCAMATTANSQAYVMPVVMNSKRFGPKYLPVIVLWELGGNLWVANFYYAIMATVYSPTSESCDSPSALKENARTAELRERSNTVEAAQIGSSESQVDLNVKDDDSPSNDRLPSIAAAGRTLPIVRQILRTPMLWGTALGIVFNLTGLPLYPTPGQPLKALASAFPPLIYALLGASLRFNIGAKSYWIILKVLAAKVILNGIAAWILRAIPLFDAATRSVICLCVVGPIATPFLSYSYRLGHNMEIATVLYNLSAVISIAALNLLVQVV